LLLFLLQKGLRRPASVAQEWQQMNDEQRHLCCVVKVSHEAIDFELPFEFIGLAFLWL